MDQQGNLTVRVLGPLAVAVDGREVPPHELASRKGRTVLKLLLARRGEVVPAGVLAEVLWPGRPPADPTPTSPPWSAGCGRCSDRRCWPAGVRVGGS